jgi:hypothetical protein
VTPPIESSPLKFLSVVSGQSMYRVPIAADGRAPSDA